MEEHVEGHVEGHVEDETRRPMPVVDSAELAKVIVANVYAGGATVELELPWTTTILGLKGLVAARFASAPSEQRLIYCGKICKDDEQLKDVMTGSPTFHLVVTKREVDSTDYNYHLAMAAVYAEALREGRWMPSRTTRVTQFAARIRRNRAVAALDFKLALKLAVAVALLGHDGNLVRLAVLSWLALVAYAVQTGLARMLLENVSVAPADSGILRQLASGRIPRGADRRLYAPLEFLIFVLTFAVSLAPAWRPNAAIEPPQQPPREHAD